MAQGRASIGLKAGVNVANFIGDDAESSERTYGFAGGAYLELPVGRMLSVRPEVLYSARGGKLRHSLFNSDAIMETKLDMNYLDVPVLGVLTFMDTYQIFAGPMWGFFLDGESEGETSLFEEKEIPAEQVNSPQTGVMVGAGIKFGDFNLEARYIVGLSQTLEETKTVEDLDLKSGLGQVMLVLPF